MEDCRTTIVEKGPWETRRLTMQEIIVSMLIPWDMYQSFHNFILQHSLQHVKLCGILFRHACSYLFFPIAIRFLDRNEYQPEAHLWAWHAWQKIKGLIEDIHQNFFMKTTSRQIRILPFCFKCFSQTDRTCSSCRSTCNKYGLRLIPTCKACFICRACAIDKNFDPQDRMHVWYFFA